MSASISASGQRIFGTEANADRVWRAGAETVLSATLVVFLFAYLNLGRWHVRASHVAGVWLAFLLALVGLAVYDPAVAAGVARISLATVAAVGFILVVYLATHGVERAVMLIPTWLLLVVWVCAAAFTVNGSIANDLASPALLGGLVLLVMLIGFTIMQSAFAAGGVAHGAISDVERKALALTGSNDIIFDWDVINDRIYVSPEIEDQLGLKRGELEGPASSWMSLLHPLERDRYRACLDTVLEQRRGRVSQEFRLHAADGHYFWFRLRARPVVGPDGEVVRLVGTLADVTDQKNAVERLLHDAVHDNLTGLPNREIFFDRLELALTRPQTPRATAADRAVRRHRPLRQGQRGCRRLGRQFHPADGGPAAWPPAAAARHAGAHFRRHVRGHSRLRGRDRSRSSIWPTASAARCRRRSPSPIREIALAVSVGIALFDPQWHPKREDMLKDAEIAMRYAKRDGGGRIEVFRPAHALADAPTGRRWKANLRRAHRARRDEAVVPSDRPAARTAPWPASRPCCAGSIRAWARRAGEFLPLAEETGLIVDLGLFVLQRAARELAAWQRALDVDPPIFATVNCLLAAIAAPRPARGRQERADPHAASRPARSSSN